MPVKRAQKPQMNLHMLTQDMLIHLVTTQEQPIMEREVPFRLVAITQGQQDLMTIAQLLIIIIDQMITTT